MIYRDNDVYFRLCGGYSLVRASYTVQSHSVSDGQDPDNRIYDGLTLSCGSDGKLTFQVGRKGTEAVATWFNDRVPASHTTFGHTAGMLNFAFLGTLQLTIKDGILNDEQTYAFSVALAQGHIEETGSNNWWFGGLNCSRVETNVVRAAGIDSRNGVAAFLFLRGGNDVSSVDVNPEVLVDTASWMKPIGDAARLDQIVMPGSHDAGMSELHHCAPPIGADGYTKTQSGSVGQQLADGSRYFDIRVDYDYDSLVTCHRDGGWGCNGQSLKVLLDQVRSFLTDAPSETAILKFSHIRDYDGHDPVTTKNKIDDLLNDYDTVIYKNSADPNLAELGLGAVRGKMILVFDYDEHIDPENGRFRYRDGSSVEAGRNLVVFDSYSDTSKYEDMKADQLQKWGGHGGLSNGYFFLLSWTLTPAPPGSSIEDLAAEANRKLPQVLLDQIVTKGSSKPNIVYIDFMNNWNAQNIIMYNF